MDPSVIPETHKKLGIDQVLATVCLHVGGSLGLGKKLSIEAHESPEAVCLVQGGLS